MERQTHYRRATNSKPISRLIIALVLFIPALPVYSDTLPAFTAQYALLKNGTEVGIAERSLKKQNGQLVYASTAYATGLLSLFFSDRITEKSILSDNAQLRPLEYRYDRTGGNKEEHYHVVFDWDKKQSQYKHDQTTHNLPDNIADLLSFQTKLMHEMASGKNTFHFQIALPKELREYRFRLAGEDTLELSSGKLKTLRIEQLSNGHEERFTLWMAPAYDYIPVHIERKKNKKVTELKLRKFNNKVIDEPLDEF